MEETTDAGGPSAVLVRPRVRENRYAYECSPAVSNDPKAALSAARRQRRSAGVVNVCDAVRDHATQHRLLVPDRLHKSHGPLAVLPHDLEFYGCTRRCFDQNAPAVETATEGAQVDAGLDAHF